MVPGLYGNNGPNALKCAVGEKGIELDHVLTPPQHMEETIVPMQLTV